MARPAFRFGDLTSRYGERSVLDGLDGEISSGCLTALIGPNGSGKSTLLRMSYLKVILQEKYVLLQEII